MVRLLFCSILFLSFFTGCAGNRISTSFEKQNKHRPLAFKKPTTLSQKILNYVLRYGELEETNLFHAVDPVKQGPAWSYHFRLFDDRDFYDFNVIIFKDEVLPRTSFGFARYRMSRPLSRKISAADYLADEAIWGKTGIIVEEHFYDQSFSDQLSSFQFFAKIDGPVWLPFTREERDEGIRNGKDIIEFYYRDGKVETNRGPIFFDEPPGKIYQYRIQRIAKLLKIK